MLYQACLCVCCHDFKTLVKFLPRSFDRHLCGNNHHKCKDTYATLNYFVVPSWITRRPLTSRGTLFPPLAGCNEMLKGTDPLIPKQREGEPARDALNLQVSGRRKGTLLFQTTVLNSNNL
ncbi:hypothetical protein TNCV_1848711 [Trichonephila clavipes]|nr:hypothetical protein TNCV_1848711 [Trichonephila clavipes]